MGLKLWIEFAGEQRRNGLVDCLQQTAQVICTERTCGEGAEEAKTLKHSGPFLLN